MQELNEHGRWEYGRVDTTEKLERRNKASETLPEARKYKEARPYLRGA